MFFEMVMNETMVMIEMMVVFETIEIMMVIEMMVVIIATSYWFRSNEDESQSEYN